MVPVDCMFCRCGQLKQGEERGTRNEERGSESRLTVTS